MAVPEALRSWLKRYDRDLSLDQDEPTGRTKLLYRGRPVCVCKHSDGTPIRNLDLCQPEIRDLVRKCDQNKNGTRMDRFIADRTLEREHSRARQKARVADDGRRAAKDLMRHRRFGPKVVVGPHN